MVKIKALINAHSSTDKMQPLFSIMSKNGTEAEVKRKTEAKE